MINTVHYSVRDRVARITLDRQNSLNALNNSMIAGIGDGIRRAANDPEVRVLIVEGAGRTFCAGDDLIDMGTEEHPKSQDTLEEYLRGYPALVIALRQLEKPVICKVQRYALGAGLEIALACDFIVAEEGSKIGLPFALRGIAAGTALLPSLVPRQIAARLLYSGELVGVMEAQAWGLISQVVSAGEIESTVNALATDLSNAATRAIGLMKGAIMASEGAPLATAMRLQASATVSSALTHDFAEGATAFAEKRTANYAGR